MAPPKACLKGCAMRKDRNLALQGELFLVSIPYQVREERSDEQSCEAAGFSE